MQGFGGGNLLQRDHLEDVYLHGRIIVKGIFQELDGGRELDRAGSG